MTAEHTRKVVPDFVRDGGHMPVLGLGTFQLTGEACRNAVRTGLDIGYRHLDTARAYENETQVGQGIRDAGLSRATRSLGL
jgi:diketogulonate reductase-like aldo/keto reductase